MLREETKLKAIKERWQNRSKAEEDEDNMPVVMAREFGARGRPAAVAADGRRGRNVASHIPRSKQGPRGKAKVQTAAARWRAKRQAIKAQQRARAVQEFVRQAPTPQQHAEASS